MHTILALAVGPQRDVLITPPAVTSGALKNVRPYVEGLITGLANLGRKLGTDFEIDYREREVQNLQPAMAEAVKTTKTKIPLVFPLSTSALQAAMSVSTSIPIVFPSSSDPVDDGAVNSFAVPGKNATGICAMRSQTADDCLELFKATVPSLTEVFALHKPKYQPALRALQKVRLAADLVGVTFTPVCVLSQKDIDSELTKISQQGSEGAPQRGILVLPDDVVLSAALTISQLALERGLPTFFPVTDWVKQSLPSALAGFGIPQVACGEAAAEYVDKILWRGAVPADLPVKRGGRFEFKVSTAVADALKINIPDRVRRAVDR